MWCPPGYPHMTHGRRKPHTRRTSEQQRGQRMGRAPGVMRQT